MSKVFLKKKISDRILVGHPWIFQNEIEKLDGTVTPGQIIDVFTYNQKFIGRGYYNQNSQIIIRLLTREINEKIDKLYFLKKFRSAKLYRTKIGYTENYRLFFGESDGIPQLIIDKYGEYFVIQTLALGIDLWKNTIVECIIELFQPKGIYERNDVSVRKLEGLELIKGFLSEDFETKFIIQENGLRFLIDIANGQKTGFFLDQKENRLKLQYISKDADVLGVFCYTGSFELFSAFYGAKSVVGVDISGKAIENCLENAKLNKLENKCQFICLDGFDVLNDFIKEGKKFDIVMIDPPSFTKDRKNVENAIKGYKEINLKALKLVSEGGFLVSTSCTHLIYPDMFYKILLEASLDANVKIKQFYFNTQSPDHPIVWGLDNSMYLKFYILQVWKK